MQNAMARRVLDVVRLAAAYVCSMNTSEILVVGYDLVANSQMVRAIMVGRQIRYWVAGFDAVRVGGMT